MGKTSNGVSLATPFDASKIRICHDKNFSTYAIDLPLDNPPDSDWVNIFEQKWRSSRQFWDRKVILLNDKIRLWTSVDGYEEKLEWIRQVIVETNAVLKEYNDVVRREREITVLQTSGTPETVREILRQKIFT